MQKTHHHTAAEGTESDVMYTLRPLLTTYAYNITGSLEEARDLVQDAYLRFMQATATVENPRAYLVRTVINLSINRQQQRKRTGYPGEWLPEPVATDMPDGPLLSKDVLRYSLMVLLEKLNARERAVFILREAFSYTFAEIAALLGTSEANTRQLLSRAKKQLRNYRPAADATAVQTFPDKYLALIREGDTERLEALLKEDIVAVSDGGGKVPAAQQPVAGRKAVSALLQGMYNKFYQAKDVRSGSVNHQPALFYYHEGRLTNCQVFTLEDGCISGVYFIRNPEKLQALDFLKK
jgi:RNA polymerase sigma-70 factor (ECF subfamily)